MSDRTAPSAPLLEARGLTKRFGQVTALSNISFALGDGEIVALCGENGAGKSTLIKVLSGVYPAGSYEGQLLLNGQPAAFATIRDAEANNIGVIHQELALIEEMSVTENLFLGRELKNGLFLDWEEMTKQTTRIFERLKIDIPVDRKVMDLSVAEQQLVEIARAISKDSRIIIFDEPTAALAAREIQALLDLLLELKAQGKSLIYISHKLDEVFALADRVVVLRDGQTVSDHPASETSPDQVVTEMVGRPITALYPPRVENLGEVVLEVKNLSFSEVDETGRLRPRVHNVSFQLRAGEVLGFGGLMGAGRSELLYHLIGAAGVRTSGEVIFCGKSFKPRSVQEALEAGIVLATEDRKRSGLFLEHPIGFNLSISSLPKLSNRGFIRHEDETTENRSWMKKLRVKALGPDTIVGTLSGGNQQKVVLGKVLMAEPKVVMVDEPTRGIDIGAKREIYDVVQALKSEGKAVILVSSELPELIGVSDRIIMLCEGRVGGEFPAVGVTEKQLMSAALKVSGAHSPSSPQPTASTGAP